MHATFRRLGVGALAALIATAGFAIPAHAATEPATFPASSDAPVYLIDGNLNVQYAKGTQLAWDAPLGAFLSAIAVPTAISSTEPMRMPTVAGATDYVPFISTPGNERTRSAWSAYSDAVPLAGSGALTPEVTPVSLGYGAPAGVKSAGGTYSLGIAYVNGAASGPVVKAYYTTINVDPTVGTWKFATPPGAICTPTTVQHTTTTSLVANPTTGDVGTTSTLTATVTSDVVVPGNVSFGSTLGTVALASGSATKSVTIATAGANTFSASYVDTTITSTDGCTIDHFAASTSANAIITGTVPAVQLPPNAPSENSLNTNTAHGATVVYDSSTHKATLTVAGYNTSTVNVFAYSVVPTYLGQLVVSGTGTITVDLSTLPAGTHKLAIVDPATGVVLAWATFTKSDAAISPSISKTINADVANGSGTPTDGEFSIIDTSGSTVVNLTNPALVNGQSVVSGSLGTFKVTDLRAASKQGWDLKTTVSQFVKGTDTIENSALGITPKSVSNAGTGATAPVLGAATVSGSAVYPWTFASLAAGAFSGVSVFNADLVFTAPAAKPAGTYTSTLTLTLISK